MKGIKLLFIGCLTSLAFGAFNYAVADDSADAARAATRRNATTTITRQQSDSDSQSNTANSISRYTSSTTTAASGESRDRSAVTPRTNVVSRDASTRTTSDSSTQSVSARTMSTVLPRTTTSTTSSTVSPSRTATTRNASSTVSRTGIGTVRNTTTQTTNARSAATTVSRNTGISRAVSNTIMTTPTSGNTSRSAAIPNTARISRAGTLTAEEIIGRDSSKCREVYYSCMDEFCANKDSQLKRCACSSRVNEFDSIKNQLSTIEDKLLDFNQRLLTVNMDKEDAEAIFQATEGELAFQKEDSSESKKLLDEISSKLNTTFDTSTFDTNLAPISLSLNAEAAFDSVDSLAGASTTTKTGTALYSAALPICREMALEVCTQDELDIIESGYQMAIEQDCNTVAKTYQSQQDLAREKIREGSALLDMSRLDIYQQRNSDDILTCKKKMLDMLTNTSVCGTDLQKCLDISGQYIDPSSGEAILTSNLVNLSTLITRPEANQTWTTAPGNEKFVNYLNSKKMFLESATESCQDIADYVWDLFIEDALAQIKLAQENKLEEVRQSCTTLTTQCLTEAAESLEDFDARALSIFGVEADKTVKQMCAEVQTACTALLDTTDGGKDWTTGITDIATEKTYETILQTCREVGRACIIQSCKSISGNFGLCENIQTSVNRKAIINRTACWNEVLDCVASAGTDSINKITEQQSNMLDELNKSFYTQLYGPYTVRDITNDELNSSFEPSQSCIITNNNNCIYDICSLECGFNAENSTYNATELTSDKCQICRLAERVWGNCEAHPSSSLKADNAHNKIKIPEDSANETLMSWFAKNTNTEDAADSCRDTSCGPGYLAYWDPDAQASVCVSKSNMSDDGKLCPPDTYWRFNVNGYNNCCISNNNTPGARDAFGNCCLLGKTTPTKINGLDWYTQTGYYGPDAPTTEIKSSTNLGNATGKIPNTTNYGLCIPDNATFIMAFPSINDPYYGTGIGFLFCDGTKSEQVSEETQEFPNGKTVKCNGDYIIVLKLNNGTSVQYVSPNYTETESHEPIINFSQLPINFYRQEDNVNTCRYDYDTSWKWQTVSEDTPESCSTPNNWIINYN